jgi:hypothetical protein
MYSQQKPTENIYLNVSYFLQSSMGPIKWRCSIPNIPPKDYFCPNPHRFHYGLKHEWGKLLAFTSRTLHGTTNSWDSQVLFTKSKHLGVS